MDQFQKDIISFQERISKLNEYGVQVTCQRVSSPKKNDGDDKTDKKNDNYCVKVNVNDFIIDQAETSNDQDMEIISKTESPILSQPISLTKKIIKEFSLKQGLNTYLSGDQPIDYFVLMANEEMFKSLLKETNKNLQDMREESGVAEFTADTTLHELIRFLGLLFHMGTIQINRIVDYWSNDPLFSLPCFSQYIDQNRFMVLLKCLHFKKIIEHFNGTMTKIYTPGKILTVKEPLFYIDGRLKRKILTLPDNTVSVNCVSDSTGVILKCVISNKISENIVSELLVDHVYANRSVFVTQIYSSVRLAHRLLEQSTTCTGLLPNDTLRLANMVQEKPLIGIVQKGAFIGRWKKDSSVFFSSEYVDMEDVSEDSFPKALTDYNKYINDDKINDELLAYYTCERRQMSLDKKLIIHIFQMMLMNSYYMYNNENELKKSTLYDFRLAVIRSLVDPDLSKWSLDQDIIINHKPVLLKQDSLGRQRRKKCNVCFYQKSIRQDTQYYCPRCPNLPGLCLDSCFKSYHALNKN